MTAHLRDDGRRTPFLLRAAAAVVVTLSAAGALSACSAADAAKHDTTPATSRSATDAAVGSTGPVAAPSSSTTRHIYGVADAPSPVAAVSPPTHVSVPSIGVSSGLQSLGLLKDGSLEPPTKWQVAGWYAKGVVPGQVGPAVIAGHVDSVSGPAVFFKLKLLKVGAKVYVSTRDHHTLTFVVRQIQEFSKKKFPTEAVYGPTPDPVLRLVTCTGDFDRSKRSYVDNLVVTAALV